LEYKIAWFTEGNWGGKVPVNHPNMRNDMAWMHHLDVDHYPILNIDSVKDSYDLGIVTIPKTNIEHIMDYPMIEHMKRVCKKIAFMQEGPCWYFHDYPIEQQIWFFNILMEMDALFVHNRSDIDYFSGITDKKCYLMRTLMIEDFIEESTDKLDAVMIGGNMCRWYGGFDSYLIAQQFDLPIYAPSMGRKVHREEEMDITHLPYMSWVEWIKELSKFKYAVHLMPTQAAGTFALNCAYWGIPCVGYKGLDTQSRCFPQLSVDIGNIHEAKKIVSKLINDDSFRRSSIETAKTNYETFFGRNEFDKTITKSIKEIMK
jgi:hypothetical protein